MTISPHMIKADPVRVTALKIVPKDGQKAGEYRKITPKEAKKMMDSGEDLIILDVRAEEEYRQGHIKGAILIPDTDIEKKAADLLPDKEKAILIYCRSGRRSELAAKKLCEMGYMHALDFGGLINWPYETQK